MSDIVVRPLPSGWTVRHERALFERFEDRAAALRRARRLAALLKSNGEAVTLRLEQRRPAA